MTKNTLLNELCGVKIMHPPDIEMDVFHISITQLVD